jgi:hypothetical protein
MRRVIFTSVDEYITAQPEPARSALRQVRDAIRIAVPEAEELQRRNPFSPHSSPSSDNIQSKKARFAFRFRSPYR